MVKSVYISGPMRGYPKFNFPQFHEVAQSLRTREHIYVANPAEHDESVYPNIATWPGFESGDTTRCPEFNYMTSMLWDIEQVITMQGIVMLPGWQLSVGAKTERFVAEQVGRLVILAEDTDRGWRFHDDPVQKRMATPAIASGV